MGKMQSFCCSSSLSRGLTCIWCCDDDLEVSSPLTMLILLLQSFRARLPLIHVTLGSTHSSFIHPLILFLFILLSFICWDVWENTFSGSNSGRLTGAERAKNLISMELFISNLLTLSIAIGWHSARLAIYQKPYSLQQCSPVTNSNDHFANIPV